MAEIRVDEETGDWRIVAPERAARPRDNAGAPSVCPFCPGHEHMTPPEVMRVPAGAAHWRIRVVPNLYAFVSPDATGGDSPASGHHEVVVESDRHDWDLRLATPAELAEILAVVRARCRVHTAGGAAAVLAFRNYGAAAGNSLRHPHSQVVALDRPPPGLVNRWRRAHEHLDATGRLLAADLADAERRDGRRIVADTGGVLVYQPRAASMPHETVLLPGDDSADLAGASDETLAAVAAVLPGVLRGLATVLDDPAYNLVLHTGPPDGRRWYRWHLGLYPRVTTFAGLEIATGLAVNPTAPEVTAPVLRAVVSPARTGPAGLPAPDPGSPGAAGHTRG